MGLLANEPLEFSTIKGEKSSWIIDSGAMCHMSHYLASFVEYEELYRPEEVTLGDGHIVEAAVKGTILLNIAINNEKTQTCKLSDVLYAPELSYNLLSVSMVIKAGKTVKSSSVGCEIIDKEQNIFATATKIGSLYYINYDQRNELMQWLKTRKVKFGTEDTVILA